MGRRPSRWGSRLGTGLVGVLMGMVLMAPAGAHFTQNTRHLGIHAWNQVIKQRVFTKAQANQRFSRVARVETGSSVALPSFPDEASYGPVLSITAPARGFVTLHGSVTFRNQHDAACTASDCIAVAQIRHITTGATSFRGEATLNPTASARGNVSIAWVFPVTRGVNTFDLRVFRFGVSTGTLQAWWGMMTATFSPYGPTGSPSDL